MNNKLIILLLSVLTIIPSVRSAESTAPPTKVKRIGLEEYNKMRANTNYVLVDVRSAAEFEKGHIPRAINIDVNSLRFAEKVGALDKSKTYLVNCAVGMRSARACQKMETMGFTNLYDLAPGFDGWKQAGRPVAK